MYREGVRNGSEGCVAEVLLEQFLGKAVEDMVRIGMKNFGAGRLRQGTEKTIVEGFCYGRVVRGDEMVQCCL